MYTLYLLTRHNLKLYIHDIVLRTAFIFAIGGIVLTHLLGNTIDHNYESFISSFGLLIMNLCIAFMTIYNGSDAIYSDLINHTIENIISCGISRAKFFIGKYCALLLVNLVNLLIMSFIIILLLLIKDDFSNTYFIAIYSIAIELVFLSAITICLNVITSNIVTFYCTAAVYITGHYSDILVNLSQVTSSSLLQYIGKVFYYLIPNFSIFSTSHFIVNSSSIDMEHLLPGTIYCLIYSSIMLLLGYNIFSRRDL